MRWLSGLCAKSAKSATLFTFQCAFFSFFFSFRLYCLKSLNCVSLSLVCRALCVSLYFSRVVFVRVRFLFLLFAYPFWLAKCNETSWTLGRGIGKKVGIIAKCNTVRISAHITLYLLLWIFFPVVHAYFHKVQLWVLNLERLHLQNYKTSWPTTKVDKTMHAIALLEDEILYALAQ